MTVAEDILQDVEAETVLLNGEVVRRAFKMFDFAQCSKNGAADWGKSDLRQAFCCDHAAVTEEYEKAKRIAISANQRILDPLTESEKRWHPVWLIRQNQFAHAVECGQRQDELRARLNAIWPCLECIDREE